MKFRRNAVVILITTVAVVIISVSVVSNYIFSRMTTAVEEGQLKLIESIIAFNIKGAEDRALARAEMIADLPNARALFAAHDRKGLLEEYQEMFTQQKEKYGIDQAQFHTAPATSFLRLNDPENYGDDLSSFRPLVVAVNKDQVPRKSFAIAYTGPAILGVAPVYSLLGKHLGSFEMGIAFEGLMQGLKAAYGLEMAVFIDEAPLRAFAKGIDSSVMSEQNRVGKFIRYYASNAQLISNLIFDKDLNQLDIYHFTRRVGDVPYGVVLYPLRTQAGDVLGMVAAGSDFSAMRAAETRSMIWQALMALIAISLIAAIVIITIRGVLLAPLELISSHFFALANNDVSHEIPERELFCEELKGLTEHYEKLRKRQQK